MDCCFQLHDEFVSLGASSRRAPTLTLSTGFVAVKNFLSLGSRTRVSMS